MHPQFRDGKWIPKGQSDQALKSLGLRIIRSLKETFVINENEVFIGPGTSGAQSLSGAALNLSPLARLPLWVWHSHGFLLQKRKRFPSNSMDFLFSSHLRYNIKNAYW
jgi:hypothetical protein